MHIHFAAYKFIYAFLIKQTVFMIEPVFSLLHHMQLMVFHIWRLVSRVLGALILKVHEGKHKSHGFVLLFFFGMRSKASKSTRYSLIYWLSSISSSLAWSFSVQREMASDDDKIETFHILIRAIYRKPAPRCNWFWSEGTGDAYTTFISYIIFDLKFKSL